jgi:hypothetical protein
MAGSYPDRHQYSAAAIHLDPKPLASGHGPAHHFLLPWVQLRTYHSGRSCSSGRGLHEYLHISGWFSGMDLARVPYHKTLRSMKEA